MKSVNKLSYDDCNNLILANNEEVPLFHDTFLHKFYAVSLKKINNDIIIVGINGTDVVYLSKNEYGAAFVEDSNNVPLSYKLNIANLFIMNGYRLSLSNFDKVYLCKEDGYKYLINKIFSISLDGKSVYIQ